MALAEAVVPRPVRVVLIDDDEIIMTGLQGMLAPHRDKVELIGWVPVTEDLVPVVSRLEPDIVLIDARIDEGGERARVGELTAGNPAYRVVIFTDDTDDRRVYEALRLGVSGYLLKSSNGALLVDQLVRVSDGEMVLDPELATRVAQRAAQMGGELGWPGRQVGLSRREGQVLRLLTDGLSNRLIAAELTIGEETVKTHLRSIYRKLGVTDRAQAIAAALRQDLLS